MAEAKGPKTQKGKEAAPESWARGAEVMDREIFAEAHAERRKDR